MRMIDFSHSYERVDLFVYSTRVNPGSFNILIYV